MNPSGITADDKAVKQVQQPSDSMNASASFVTSSKSNPPAAGAEIPANNNGSVPETLKKVSSLRGIAIKISRIMSGGTNEGHSGVMGGPSGTSLHLTASNLNGMAVSNSSISGGTHGSRSRHRLWRGNTAQGAMTGNNNSNSSGVVSNGKRAPNLGVPKFVKESEAALSQSAVVSAAKLVDDQNTPAERRPAGITNSEDAQYLNKFDPDEVEVLKKIYKELSTRSGGNGIDKETFLQYFPLPTLWTNRLYQIFKPKEFELVDYHSFMSGLMACCRGTKATKMEILFQLFDLDGDGKISKRELTLVLANIPQLERQLSLAGIPPKEDTMAQGACCSNTHMGTSNGFVVGSSVRDDAPTPIQVQSSAAGSKVPEGKPANCRAGEDQTESSDRFFEGVTEDEFILTADEIVAGRLDSQCIEKKVRETDTQTASADSVYRKASGEDSDAIKPEEEEPDMAFDVEVFATSVMENFEAQEPGYLLLAEFKSFVQHYPFLLQIFSDGLRDEVWGLQGNALYRAQRTPFGQRVPRLEPTSNPPADQPELADDDSLSQNITTVVKSLPSSSSPGEAHPSIDIRSSNVDASGIVRRNFIDSRLVPRSLLPPDGVSRTEAAFLSDRGISSGVESERPESEGSKHPSITLSADPHSVAPTLVRTKSIENGKNRLTGISAESGVTSAEGGTSRKSHSLVLNSQEAFRIERWVKLQQVFRCQSAPQPHNVATGIGLQGESVIATFSPKQTGSFSDSPSSQVVPTSLLPFEGSNIPQNAAADHASKIYPRHAKYAASLEILDFLHFSALQWQKATLQDGIKAVQGPSNPAAGESTVMFGDASANTALSDLFTQRWKSIVNNHHGSTQSTGSVALGECVSGPDPVRNSGLAGQVVVQKDGVMEQLPAGAIIGASIRDDPSKEEAECLCAAKTEIELQKAQDVTTRQSMSSVNEEATTMPNIIFSCPNCEVPLIVCPNCNQKFPRLKITADDRLLVACSKCHGSQNRNAFTKCWFCNWPFQKAVDSVDRREIVREGTLLKLGKAKGLWISRHYVLIDKLLYYYARKRDAKPKGFIFLEGCFVEPLDEMEKFSNHAVEEVEEPLPPEIKRDDQLYGLVISHAGGTSVSRKLYAPDEKTRDQWITSLRQALDQQSIQNLYELKEIIGYGKFSVVYKAIERLTGKEYAVKVITKGRMQVHEREMLRSEISILSLLKHPNVVYLKSKIDSKDSLALVMENVRGGELYDLVATGGTLTEIHVHRMVSQLLRTVAYLHKCGIVHRDLKPENILLTSRNPAEANIKIADFGLSCLCGPNEKLTQPCGTLAYVAPEVLTLQGYNHAVDIWSIGVIMHLLLIGRLPFPIIRTSGPQILAHREKFYTLHFDSAAWKDTSRSSQEVLSKLCEVDPEKRPTAEEAMSFLWIKNPTAVLKDISPTPVAKPPTSTANQ